MQVGIATQETGTKTVIHTQHILNHQHLAVHIATGTDALKLEGGEEIIGTVKRILSAGIPIMGHLGLMPQSINKYGTYTVLAKDDAEAEKLVRDAHLLEEAGCFGLVLEKIPAVHIRQKLSVMSLLVLFFLIREI